MRRPQRPEAVFMKANMNSTPVDPKTLPYLPVAEGNALVCTSSNSKMSKGMDNDDDYYDELAPDGSIVAQYYVWHHLSVYPPFPVSEGWKKFAPDGTQLASKNKH